MPKVYNGQIHIRVPPQLHEEVAREAFERGTSISALCSQALLIRRVLKDLNPWKTVDALWASNRDADISVLESDIDEAVRAARRARVPAR